jgi:hypothetical protein
MAKNFFFMILPPLLIPLLKYAFAIKQVWRHNAIASGRRSAAKRTATTEKRLNCNGLLKISAKEKTMCPQFVSQNRRFHDFVPNHCVKSMCLDAGIDRKQ